MGGYTVWGVRKRREKDSKKSGSELAFLDYPSDPRGYDIGAEQVRTSYHPIVAKVARKPPALTTRPDWLNGRLIAGNQTGAWALCVCLRRLKPLYAHIVPPRDAWVRLRQARQAGPSPSIQPKQSPQGPSKAASTMAPLKSPPFLLLWSTYPSQGGHTGQNDIHGNALKVYRQGVFCE